SPRIFESEFRMTNQQIAEPPKGLGLTGQRLWRDLLGRAKVHDEATLAAILSAAHWADRETGLIADPNSSISATAKATPMKLKAFKYLGLIPAIGAGEREALKVWTRKKPGAWYPERMKFPDGKLSEQLRVRFTRPQMKALRREAARRGMVLATWVRWTLLAE